MGEVAVEIHGLVKRYGPVMAVDRLTLAVLRHSVTAILGPNGAGKTTAMECCEGYRRPDAGSIRVLGLDPSRDAATLHSRIGVMLQAGGTYPSVRAGEILRHMARLYATPLDPTMLVERLGLRAALRTPFRRLSGGQQQRLSLATAVVGRPALVFLHDPTSGLDPQALPATWQPVRDLQEQRVPVCPPTHPLPR